MSLPETCTWTLSLCPGTAVGPAWPLLLSRPAWFLQIPCFCLVFSSLGNFSLLLRMFPHEQFGDIMLMLERISWLHNHTSFIVQSKDEVPFWVSKGFFLMPCQEVFHHNLHLWLIHLGWIYPFKNFDSELINFCKSAFGRSPLLKVQDK